MRKLLGLTLAALPAILPDAFTLSEAWPAVGFFVTLVILLYWKLTESGKKLLSEENVAAVALSCLLCFGAVIYRIGSGLTVTAAYAEPIGKTLSEVVGTEQAFAQMTEEVKARLAAVEELAKTQILLQQSEAREQDLERQYAAIERQLAAKEREVQQAFRDAELKATTERKEYFDFMVYEQWFRLDVPFSSVSLEYLSQNADTIDVDFWTAVKDEDLLLISEEVMVEILSGEKRDLEITLDFHQEGIGLLHSDSGQMSSKLFSKSGDDTFGAVVRFTDVRIPANVSDRIPLIACVSFEEIGTDLKWQAGFGFEITSRNYREVKRSYGEEPINRLTDSLSTSMLSSPKDLESFKKYCEEVPG